MQLFLKCMLRALPNLPFLISSSLLQVAQKLKNKEFSYRDEITKETPKTMRNELTLPTVLRDELPPFLQKIKDGHYIESDNDYPIHQYLRDNPIEVDETGSDVIEFLRGKSILVTGGTGFIGKLLVEKLLRCCEGINKIYIIVRSKKGKSPNVRINEYLDNWAFIRLSKIYPNFREKVIGISGDFEEDGLGLSEESRKILTEKINIIYHAAATIRFDEKLKKAVKINMKGTREIIKLAKECAKLDVLVHISTAYSNCIYKHIKEDFYTPMIEPQTIIDITDKLPGEVVDKLTSGLLGDHPNTYAFTKHLTEDMIKTETVGIPTCIQRPAIVMASVKEPVRSWIDNIFGPVGMVLAGALGLVHIAVGNPKRRCDLVPVDYCINNCIAASYQTAKDRLMDKVQIFNFTTADKNIVRWNEIGYCSKYGLKVGSEKAFAKPYYRLTTNRYLFSILHFILHILPAHVLDFVAVRLGKKPQLAKAYSKIEKFIDVLRYFTLNEWTFESTNTVNLWNSLNEKDKKIFAFDMSTLNWEAYFETYMVAIREFLMLEPLDNLEEGRTHFKRIGIIHYVVVSSVLVVSSYYLLSTIFCFVPITLMTIILYYVLTDNNTK